MKPAGIILTYMSRQDWKGKSFWVKLRTIFFNAVLFVMQLVGLVAGKILGKVKVEWRRVWRAAQVSHVRLCLKCWNPIPKRTPNRPAIWEYINFGYPKAEIQYWRIAQCDGKRFEYRDPTFKPSDEFIAAMIEYARDQVGKRYDEVQLLSAAVNLIIWLFWWPLWGREVVKWFNRPDGLEFCSSGVTADLRWAEYSFYYEIPREKPMRIDKSDFFKGYSISMVSPCLFPLSENWRVPE